MNLKTAMKNKDNDFPMTIRTLYRAYQEQEKQDPFVGPILRLSLDIGWMLHHGAITMDDLEKATQTLTLEGLKSRARRLAAYLGSCGEKENHKALDKLFRSLAHENNEPVPFAKFQQMVEHFFYGFVFTAHPTFTMPQEMAAALSGYAARLGGADEGGAFDDLRKAMDIPYTAPDINAETKFSLQAIDNLHGAFAAMFRVLYGVAADLYPDNWTELAPRLCSIATWVGFDMDGRKDIQWATTLEKRIELQTRQLQAYQADFSALIKDYGDDAALLEPALAQITATQEQMEKHQSFFSQYNQGGDQDLNALQAESKALIASAGKRLRGAGPLIEAVEKCLEKTGDQALQQKLLVLRAQLQTFGLSRAQVHFRINANQIHNAINTHIRLNTHPDHPSRRRSYIDDVETMLETVETANIDFGDIAGEEMTAKYEFMLIQQIIQYIDQENPVRFLIAETESAFTMLAALYYAKRFGVDAHVDICPLFETGRALQDSSRYMQVLLNNEQFRAYLQKRGRLCIQTGYSDAGRYIGQPAAGASIERLKERFARLFEEHDVKDIALLFFDTHGESVGRGGHPESFEQRLRYVASPYFLNKLAGRNIPYTQESSYQGGDGFLPFLTPATTLAVLTRTLEYMLRDYAAEADDPYYEEPFRSDVTKFFTVASSFQTALIENPHYADLLGAFATNMMYRSGSRAVKRVQENEGGPERLEVSQTRAIPHNAILGQYGLLANTISGMGRAFRENSDFAATIGQESSRFRLIRSLIDRAYQLSDPQIMKAYISMLDPTFWISLARQSPDHERSNKLASIATTLENHNFHNGMIEIYRKLDWDYTLLSRFRETEKNEAAENIACLHAIRLVLLRNIFLLATDIPRFGPHHPVTREQLLRIIFHMDIDRATALLENIFPARRLQEKDYDFGEVSEYRQQEEDKGYTNIRANIIAPLQNMHDMTRRISVALAHYMGFFG